MNAAQLSQKKDYPNFPEFEKFEIDLSLTDARAILALQAIRNQGGFSIIPGPAQGNWGRLEGSHTSEHYAVGRLSTAGDVFPARSKALKFWIIAQQIEAIGGLGLYLDTNGPDGTPWIMCHLDLRDKPRLLWIRDEAGNYWYETTNPIQFWRNFKTLIRRDLL